MATPFDWPALSNLTAAEKTAAAYFESLGTSIGPNRAPPKPPFNYNYGQCQTARGYLIDLERKVFLARQGVRLAMEALEAQALQTYKDANPSS